MIRILVVEDEKAISNLIAVNLRKAGYSCDCVFDGMAAADALDGAVYDLVLLDVMLPKVDGYELMSYIAPMEIPVIFLTAKAAVADRVKGLKLGADDYLTKPFEIIELLARVETVLRRYHKTEHILTVEDLVIDTTARTVKRGGELINLTKKEYELLLLFVRNQNIALYRETIYERIWGGTYMGDSRTVDIHVQRMRKKAGLEDKIVPVYKVGYRYET
jgi:DNA-binding response OmpR family regulator